MTPHDHRTLVPGCFRCELGQDESKDATSTLAEIGVEGGETELDALVEFADQHGMTFVWGGVQDHDGWPAEWGKSQDEVLRLHLQAKELRHALQLANGCLREVRRDYRVPIDGVIDTVTKTLEETS